MLTIMKNGKEVKVNYGGTQFQERMSRNGWYLKIADNYGESAQTLYDKLAATGYYSDIKIYWDSTCVRGLRKYYAFVKYN